VRIHPGEDDNRRSVLEPAHFFAFAEAGIAWNDVRPAGAGIELNFDAGDENCRDQALHPNASAPSDSSLADSSRSSRFNKEAYTAWLKRLRTVCTERKIVLIFDGVFVGFRLAPGGAQEYFGIQADMVIYGKTLGGGLPVGAVCGREELIKRYREDRPADICFARGTFNSTLT
jgi:Aminotransferase class-III